ncbi:hypothetical protein ACJD0Z_18215 [Flavobacteriaceae bacterium M23B6Z8]
MTSNHFKILLVLIVVVTYTTPVFSQDLPPPIGGDPMPITEWLLVLGASGAIYGFRKKLKK